MNMRKAYFPALAKSPSQNKMDDLGVPPFQETPKSNIYTISEEPRLHGPYPPAILEIRAATMPCTAVETHGIQGTCSGKIIVLLEWSQILENLDSVFKWMCVCVWLKIDQNGVNPSLNLGKMKGTWCEGRTLPPRRSRWVRRPSQWRPGWKQVNW